MFEKNSSQKNRSIEKSKIPTSETENKEQEERRSILKTNLELMMGDKRNQMMGALIRESVGGNAGKYKEFPCAAVNFYYDKNTGEISKFTNYPNENKDLVSGTFKIPVEMSSGSPFFKIIEKYLSPESSKKAMENLKGSIDLYNQKNVLEQEKITSNHLAEAISYRVKLEEGLI